MGRASKLNESQWATIGKRSAAGESIRALAREYGMGEASIRARVSAQTKTIKEVAKRVVENEKVIAAMPISAQIATHAEINKLRAISDNLADAAFAGSATAKALSNLAARQIKNINQLDPMDTADVLQGIAALTKLANDAAQIPIKLIDASNRNKAPADADTPPETATEAEITAEMRRLIATVR